MENVIPGFLSQAAILVFAVLGAAASITSIYKNVRGVHPQPLRVEAAEKFVPLHECEKHRSDLNREDRDLHSRIGGVDRGAAKRMEDLRLEIKTDFKGVHDRINDLAQELPGKVIDLLVKTGHLRHPQA